MILKAFAGRAQGWIDVEGIIVRQGSNSSRSIAADAARADATSEERSRFGCAEAAARCRTLSHSAHLTFGIYKVIELFARLSRALNLRVLGSIPRRLTSHSKRLLFLDQLRNLRLWLRLGCGGMRRRVIQTVDGCAIGAGNQMAIGFDRDLDRRVSSCSFT